MPQEIFILDFYSSFGVMDYGDTDISNDRISQIVDEVQFFGLRHLVGYGLNRRATGDESG